MLHSCQPTKWRSLNRFQRLSLPFSSCLSHSLLKLSSKKKNTKTLQRNVGQGCNALSAIAASCNAPGPAPRVAVLPAQRRKLQRCWPLPQQRVATRCRLRHSSELQLSAGFAAAASCNPLPASPQQRATTFCRPRRSIATLCRLRRSVALPGATVQRRHLPLQQRRLSSARPTSI